MSDDTSRASTVATISPDTAHNDVGTSNSRPDSDPLNLAPYSTEAEEAVLGSILMNPAALHEVAAFLTADDFFILRHSWIYEAFLRLHERDGALDTRTLAEELRAQERLDEVGGEAYLPSNVPTSLHAEVYGHLVERAAVRRRLLGAAGEIAQLAHDEGRDLDQVIDRAEAALAAVPRRPGTGLIPIRAVASAYLGGLEKRRAGETQGCGLPTGFPDLDGLHPGDLVVVAGRPGMGKSALLLTLALNAARQAHARIAYFSQEMDNAQVFQRALSAETGIDGQELRRGRLDDAQYSQVVAATDRLSQLPVHCDESPLLSVQQLAARCRRLQREQGLGLVVEDYVGLLTDGGAAAAGANQVQRVSYVSRALKELARELHVPVLAASQLNRAVEQRADKHPQLSDLRESGSWEQDADVVLLLTGTRSTTRARPAPASGDILSPDRS